MQKTKLYVVEGLHDEAHLKQLYPNIQTISVGGSAINKDAIDFLVSHQEQFDIYLLFDPDFPGEKIRGKVAEKLKHVTHIFIKKEDAIFKRKVGIEHVMKTTLDEAILNPLPYTMKSTLSYEAFIDLGLTGQQRSQTLRHHICDKLNIGHANAKTLFARLNMIGLTKEELKEMIHGSSV